MLAYGEVLRTIYKARRWGRDAWTWHEAADIRTFYPRTAAERSGDLVWIGNWGDDERAEELREFLIRPVKELRLKASVYGVRYPDSALRELIQRELNTKAGFRIIVYRRYSRVIVLPFMCRAGRMRPN